MIGCSSGPNGQARASRQTPIVAPRVAGRRRGREIIREERSGRCGGSGREAVHRMHALYA